MPRLTVNIVIDADTEEAARVVREGFEVARKSTMAPGLELVSLDVADGEWSDHELELLVGEALRNAEHNGGTPASERNLEEEAGQMIAGGVFALADGREEPSEAQVLAAMVRVFAKRGGE